MSRQRCHSGGSGAASKLSSIPSTTSPRLSSCCPPSRFRFLLVAVDASAPLSERDGGRGLAGSGSSADCNDTIFGATAPCAGGVEQQCKRMGGGSERSTDRVGFDEFDSVHSGVMWAGFGFACRGGVYIGERRRRGFICSCLSSGPKIYEHGSGSQDLKGHTAAGPTRCSLSYLHLLLVRSGQGMPPGHGSESQSISIAFARVSGGAAPRPGRVGSETSARH
jgi:hypothetical protein